MTVKSQKPIKFINDCGCIFDEAELIKAIEWYSTKPVIQVKHIYLHGRYPAVSIGKEKVHIHRLLMMFWLKTKIPTDFSVHHVNDNRLDNSKNNLAVIFCSLHASKHNRGKKLTESHKMKLSQSNHKRKGVRHKPQKPQITPQMVFTDKNSGLSFNQISKKYGLDWGCVRQRYEDFIHDNPELVKEEAE